MPQGTGFSKFFEPFNDGSNLRQGLLRALDPQCETAEWTEFSCEQFISLPWLVLTANIGLRTSPHWFKDVDVEELDKTGVYVALELIELGAAIFSGQQINQSNFNCAPNVKQAFGSSRWLTTRDSLHITLGYLPRLDRDTFTKMETHLRHIIIVIGCWKQYLHTNKFEDLSDCVKYWFVTEWREADNVEPQRFTHRALDTFDGKRWPDLKMCIEDIVRKFQSQEITNVLLQLDTETSLEQTVKRLVSRDKQRELAHNRATKEYQDKLSFPVFVNV